jgi:3-deoxy-D-manno-octulosonate 8-phosphate phosphatase (KDO 8-P phosphatase)
MKERYFFILDCDGVLTDGSFYYDANGKCMKKFGRDDADGFKILKKLEDMGEVPHIEVHFCSSDFHGFDITKKRVEDMGFTVDKVSVADRPDWIKKNFKSKNSTIFYMGDSFVDIPIFKTVDWSICPKNGDELARDYADYVTDVDAGNGAVADAIFWMIQNRLPTSFRSKSDIIDKVYGIDE